MRMNLVKFFPFLFPRPLPCDFFDQGISEGALRTGFRLEILAIMVHGSIINSVRVKVYHGRKVDQERINLDEIALVVWDRIKKQSALFI